MKCGKCGCEQIPSSAKFCAECGGRLIEPKKEKDNVKEGGNGQRSKYEEWEGTTNGMVFSIVVGGIFLAIVWITGMSIFSVRVMITIAYVTAIWKWLKKKGIV